MGIVDIIAVQKVEHAAFSAPQMQGMHRAPLCAVSGVNGTLEFFYCVYFIAVNQVIPLSSVQFIWQGLSQVIRMTKSHRLY